FRQRRRRSADDVVGVAPTNGAVEIKPSSTRQLRITCLQQMLLSLLARLLRIVIQGRCLMTVRRILDQTLHAVCSAVMFLAAFQLSLGPVLAATARPGTLGHPVSPIKHVIVIIGENRSFDHVFATYQPQRGEFVRNLLSQEIINADGTPGRNFSKAQQLAATDKSPDAFLLNPSKAQFPQD